MCQAHRSPRIHHVDDLADAVLYLLHCYDAEPIADIGWDEDATICELAEVAFVGDWLQGRLIFDSSQPDGARQLLDVTRQTNLVLWFKERSAGARL
jgi:GDP-L-fucose synthase